MYAIKNKCRKCKLSKAGVLFWLSIISRLLLRTYMPHNLHGIFQPHRLSFPHATLILLSNFLFSLTAKSKKFLNFLPILYAFNDDFATMRMNTVGHWIQRLSPFHKLKKVSDLGNELLFVAGDVKIEEGARWWDKECKRLWYGWLIKYSKLSLSEDSITFLDHVYQASFPLPNISYSSTLKLGTE